MIFFCSAEVQKALLRANPKEIDTLCKSHPGHLAPAAMHDSSRARHEMFALGLVRFAAAGQDIANAELFKKYNARPGTLVLCGPDGEAVARTENLADEGELLKLLAAFSEKYQGQRKGGEW
ncbi:MAG TPA: hypothetical protein VGP72_21600 [Planctomycetota bacterium]